MATAAFSKVTFDHLGIRCPSDVLKAETDFLSAALASVGIKEQFRMGEMVVAMGADPTKPDFWITAIESNGQPIQGPVTRIHIAFRAQDRAQVDEFYKAGLAAGGEDNGAPGIRENYHPGYYGAFVRSPAGHAYEVVYHDWSWRTAGQ